MPSGSDTASWPGGIGGQPVLESLGGDGSTLLLGWIGGACDASVQVSIDASVAAISVVTYGHIPAPGELPWGCPAVGITRSITLVFDHPIDPSAVTSTTEPPLPTDPPAPAVTPEPLVPVTPSSTASTAPSPRPVVHPTDVPAADADVTIVPLSLGFGPEKLRLIVADRSHSLVDAKPIGDAEYRRGVVIPGWRGWPLRRTGDDHTILVAIPGQVCDEWARIVIGRHLDRFDIFDGPHPGCDAMGIAWPLALSFDRAISFDSLTLSEPGWPWEDATPEDIPELAQRITRSLGPTVVIDWHVIRDLTDGEQLVRVVLGGRYRFCDGSGICSVEIGHEIFDLSTNRPQLYGHRIVEGLP